MSWHASNCVHVQLGHLRPQEPSHLYYHFITDCRARLWAPFPSFRPLWWSFYDPLRRTLLLPSRVVVNLGFFYSKVSRFNSQIIFHNVSLSLTLSSFPSLVVKAALTGFLTEQKGTLLLLGSVPVSLGCFCFELCQINIQRRVTFKIQNVISSRIAEIGFGLAIRPRDSFNGHFKTH